MALEQRIASLTGLNLQPPYAEYLQVVNYGLGGHYEPHFDHATVSRPVATPGAGMQRVGLLSLSLCLDFFIGIEIEPMDIECKPPCLGFEMAGLVGLPSF